MPETTAEKSKDEPKLDYVSDLPPDLIRKVLCYLIDKDYNFSDIKSLSEVNKSLSKNVNDFKKTKLGKWIGLYLLASEPLNSFNGYCANAHRLVKKEEIRKKKEITNEKIKNGAISVMLVISFFVTPACLLYLLRALIKVFIPVELVSAIIGIVLAVRHYLYFKPQEYNIQQHANEFISLESEQTLIDVEKQIKKLINLSNHQVKQLIGKEQIEKLLELDNGNIPTQKTRLIEKEQIEKLLQLLYNEKPLTLISKQQAIEVLKSIKEHLIPAEELLQPLHNEKSLTFSNQQAIEVLKSIKEHLIPVRPQIIKNIETLRTEMLNPSANQGKNAHTFLLQVRPEESSSQFSIRPVPSEPSLVLY